MRSFPEARHRLLPQTLVKVYQSGAERGRESAALLILTQSKRKSLVTKATEPFVGDQQIGVRRGHQFSTDLQTSDDLQINSRTDSFL